MSVVNYDVLYDELLQEYLGAEYYPAVNNPTTYISTEIEATTIDEYLTLLIKGFINVRIRPELDKHIMELLADDWFHQWPLVQCTYASRLLSGIGCEADTDRAIEILDLLAKIGCPNAMFRIGLRYWYGTIQDPPNPGRAVCLWLEASKKGCRETQEFLKQEYQLGNYKKLNEELQMFLVYEILMLYLESKNATKENYAEQFNGAEMEEFNKIVRRGKRLEKVVSDRALMRSSAAGLIWDKDENPYKIDF